MLHNSKGHHLHRPSCKWYLIKLCYMAALSLLDTGTELSCLGGRWIYGNEHIHLSKLEAIKHCNQSTRTSALIPGSLSSLLIIIWHSMKLPTEKRYDGQKNEYLFSLAIIFFIVNYISTLVLSISLL